MRFGTCYTVVDVLVGGTYFLRVWWYRICISQPCPIENVSSEPNSRFYSTHCVRRVVKNKLEVRNNVEELGTPHFELLDVEFRVYLVAEVDKLRGVEELECAEKSNHVILHVTYTFLICFGVFLAFSWRNEIYLDSQLKTS